MVLGRVVRESKNNTNKWGKKQRGDEDREGKSECKGRATGVPLTCRSCRGSVRASSTTKCQLSPWATVNEEFMGNIRD